MLKWLQRLFTEAPAETAQPDLEPMGPIHAQKELGEPTTSDPFATENRSWIGVDLDGTLARYDGWQGIEHIGEPIPEVCERIINWIEQGYKVKIMTARASVPEGIQPVKDWLKAHDLPELEVTCSKDFDMIELWDDRAIQVVPNTGSPVLSARWGAMPRAPLFGLEKKTEKDGS